MKSRFSKAIRASKRMEETLMRILLLIFLLANYDCALAQGTVVRFVDVLGEGQIKESLTITLKLLDLHIVSIDFELDEETLKKVVDINLLPGKYSYEISARTKVEDRWFQSKCHAKGVVNIRGGEVFGFCITSDPREGDYDCELRQIGSMYAEPTPPIYSAPPQRCNSTAWYACNRQCHEMQRRCNSACGGSIGRAFSCYSSCRQQADTCLRNCKFRYCP